MIICLFLCRIVQRNLSAALRLLQWLQFVRNIDTDYGQIIPRVIAEISQHVTSSIIFQAIVSRAKLVYFRVLRYFENEYLSSRLDRINFSFLTLHYSP